MKKVILILALTIFTNCFSQAIKVDTNSYSTTQLVNSVLINSPCVSATNVTTRTGSNFGSVNGIGFFQNTNPRFPMKSGVILSTGNVTNAVGPNATELNDGNASWPGDSSLESTLAQSGITMNSTNATVLEFDFTPISPTFSFEFLFASEEYGNFQCQFSDAFAFLLTNVNTGVTTNLAIVPNTTLPISVVTIRDYLYNSSCPSANAEYFGSYNGDSAAAGSATNFNGQTKLLNAFATLIPNTPYHIKLVIADRSDSGSDSAIFIASDTFNIGQDVLGQDLTVANNTAVCFGSSHILTTNLSPTEYTFKWTKDGVIIPGATSENLTITKAGKYGVTYEKISSTCQPITNTITVEYAPQIVTKNPTNLYKCDTGSATYQYDLSLNTPIIKTGLNPLTEVSYFASLSDANANVNALPTIYTGSPSQTVYVRIKNYNNSCFIVKSFQLLTTTPVVAYQPQDMTQCETTLNSKTSVFRLSKQNFYILNGQPVSQNSVNYYLSLSDANNATNPLNFNSYTGSNNTVIYARVQNIYDMGCYSVTSFKLIVNPIPLVDKLENVIPCDTYVLPPLVNGNYFTGPNGTGTKLVAGDTIDKTKTIYIFNQPDPLGCSASSSFTITIIDLDKDIPKSGTYCGSYNLPTLKFGNYFTEAGGKGTKITFGSKITSTSTFYFYFKSTEAPFCEIDTDFTVTIVPIQSVGNFENVFDCTSYTLPSLTVGNYYTKPNGTGNMLTAGTVITKSQTIYVFSTTGSPNYCTSQDSFEVVIGINQTDVSQCGSFKLPALPIGKYYTGRAGTGDELKGGTVISESKTVYIYIPSTNSPNCTDDYHFEVTIGQPKIDVLDNITVCESFTLPVLANGGAYYNSPNGVGTTLNAGDKITATKTIYIYKSSGTNCSNQSSFKVTVNQKPQIDSRSDIDVCNFYELTPLKIGDYYTGPGGTGTKLAAGTLIKSSQTIYIYAVSNASTNCTDENSFKINIFSIEADAPKDVSACDSYTLPALKIGNYYSKSGGPSTGEGSLMHAGDVITSTRTIYVYTESGERINCSDENSFVVTINKTPVVPVTPNVNACNSYTLPKLSVGNYYTGPNGTGPQLKENDVILTNQTIYVYAQTATTPNCSDEKSFTVTLFNVDELPNVTICENYTLPVLKSGKYYTGSNGTGTLLNAGQVLNSSQKVYIYGASPFSPSCYDESSFAVTIVKTPVANSVPSSLTTLCDEDGVNDGITTFDLAQFNSIVLGNQTTPEFTVKYYGNQIDAVNDKNALLSTNLKLVFVRVSNTLTANCYDLKTITFTVMKVQSPEPKGGIICFDSKTNTLLNSYTISSGLNPSGFIFSWSDENGKIVGTASTYEAKLPGKYILKTTSKATGCSSFPIAVEVLPSEPATISYALSEDFADNPMLTIETTGVGGDYEYQLDSGPYQDSPVFQNIESGSHTVTVRDKNGCGISTTKILVVNYPKYFTPNGDGVNDTWNISPLKDQTNSVIHIYDRYGKLLTQIFPSGQGWDGSYFGKNMPSTDYWFTVNYIEDGISKEFKSHFALKR
jgi:gliding motility-associated-like protein